MKTLKRPMMWCIFFGMRTPKTMFPSVRHTNTQIRDGMLKEGKRWFGHNSIICMIYISLSQGQQNILNVHNHHQIIIITDKIKSVVFILPRVLTSSTGRAGAAMVFWGWGGVPGVPGVLGVSRRPRPNQRCHLHLWCRYFVNWHNLLTYKICRFGDFHWPEQLIQHKQRINILDLQDLLIRRFSLTRLVDSSQTQNQHSRLTRFVDSEIFIDQNSWFYTNRESTF